MATFCLIHGSGQNASAWQLLERELVGRGHDVVAPSMPANTREAGADLYAVTVVDSLPGQTELVLVAHSASGLFLPVVADPWLN